MDPCFGTPYVDLLEQLEAYPLAACTIPHQIADLLYQAPWSTPQVRDKAMAPLLAKLASVQQRAPDPLAYLQCFTLSNINGMLAAAATSASLASVAQACRHAKDLQGAEAASAALVNALQPFLDAMTNAHRLGTQLTALLESHPAPPTATAWAQPLQDTRHALQALAARSQGDATRMGQRPELACYGCGLMMHRTLTTLQQLVDGHTPAPVALGKAVFYSGAAITFAARVQAPGAATHHRDDLLRLTVKAALQADGPEPSNRPRV